MSNFEQDEAFFELTPELAELNLATWHGPPPSEEDVAKMFYTVWETVELDIYDTAFMWDAGIKVEQPWQVIATPAIDLT
jgi:hypothetical protein